ncbi:retrovirus-related pol polyprotein from transposon TNT 1-94 [Tanacetum coccineum]|uniref:Retrovirus-related pol polyprotein from transposon TNT 1-94 n=1 Tax=Tanacetum coccineum TaxID=301880 RepID=A0ABQ5DXB5_9ASTR
MEKWKMNELIAMCVQEEERLKIEKPDTAYPTTLKATKRKFLKVTKVLKGKKEILTRQVQVMARNQDLNVDSVRILAISKRSAQGFENEKSESLDVFKIFKVEVENQQNLKIKIVRSDRGGEYYGKHFDLGQSPRPFSLYCQENGIVNQFTMPYTPQQNGVAERRNHTLTDMVRTMICNSILLEFLWTEALKTATHILNRVPSKSVLKMPFEFWTGRTPSLRYFKIWGCPTEAKNFNPQTKKLDSRTISCYFIGYPE